MKLHPKAFRTGALANFEGAAGHSVRTTHVKTLCFLIPLLQRLDTRSAGIAKREGLFPWPNGGRYIRS